MADNIISTFLVALGFDDAAASSMVAKTKKSMADYERAVKEAEKRIEDAKWEGAKTQEEIAKLTRETNLKEARAALASAQEREKSEQETARKREERHKEFVAGLNRTALAAAAAATAITYAVNKLTSAFDNLGFVSQRTGASVQSLNSLGYAFKQTGGTAQQAVGAVEKFAQALRNNDGLKGMVKGLGVDTTKDMSEVYLNTIEALSKHEYQVGSREAGLFGISEEDYKLVTDHLRQIREYRDEYNRTTRSLGIDSQKATEASQSFWRSLNKLQATASALTDKLMVSLAPALEIIVRRINDWIAANPEKVEKIMRGIGEATDAIAGGLSKVADWFGNEGNQRAIGEFWEKFNKYVRSSVKEITDLLGLFDKLGRYIGLKPGDDPIGVLATRALGNQQQVAPGDTSAGKAYTPLLQRGLNAVKRGLGIGGSESSGDAGRPIRATSRNIDPTVSAYIRKAAAARGINPDIAIAVADGEGLGGSTPNRLTPGDFVNGRATSFGPFQIHRGGRGSVGTEYERATGHSADDPTYWQEQIDFALSWAKKHGWAAWYGRSKHNVGVREGLNYKAATTPDAAPAPAPMPRPAMPRANMTPSGFDPNNIDPKNLLQPAPASASPTTNNTSNSRSVTQHIQNTTTITGTDRPKEAARVMESAFGRMHGLALANAQSAVV